MDNATTRTVKREVVMGIKADKEGIVRKIRVTFDMSKLTDDEIADWAVSSNGIRVWYQNRERTKGDKHLVELSQTPQTVEVPPCGTRVARTMTEAEFLASLSPERMEALLAQMAAKMKKPESIE